jgi:hypothetical protein
MRGGIVAAFAILSLSECVNTADSCGERQSGLKAVARSAIAQIMTGL